METYFTPKDLPKFEEIGEEAPELAAKFFAYYGEVFAEGELTEREKARIALPVPHTIQRRYYIEAYTRARLEKGSHLGEMTEALHVAVAIRCGAEQLPPEFRYTPLSSYQSRNICGVAPND